MNAPTEYVRFETHPRYHAVYVTLAPGKSAVHITYCERTVSAEKVTGRSFAPRARCSHCVGRMRHPYLISPAVRAVKERLEEEAHAAQSH